MDLPKVIQQPVAELGIELHLSKYPSTSGPSDCNRAGQ